MENSRNGTDRVTERIGPCNGTKRTVERNETDRFTPFLGKRCRRATQTERTDFRTFLDAYRMCMYVRTVCESPCQSQIPDFDSFLRVVDSVHLPIHFLIDQVHTW